MIAEKLKNQNPLINNYNYHQNTKDRILTGQLAQWLEASFQFSVISLSYG